MPHYVGMDNVINTQTGDYAGKTTTDLQNAVYLRLTVELGSWWADPTLGSRLYLLVREKDTAKKRLLAQQYAEQALQPIVDDGRASSITIIANHPVDGVLTLHISVMQSNNQLKTFTHNVRVS